MISREDSQSTLCRPLTANESHTVSELVAGVDLGGTTISIALADPDGTIAAESQIATDSHEGPKGVLARIAECVEHLSKKTGRVPAALGMGVPGLVDLASGRTRFLPNLPTQWRDVPVADILQERLNCPVSLLNDARAATLGELRFGLGRDVSTMAMFTLGTGVGGGVAVNGRLLLGPFGSAGELGHQTIVPDGPPCGCGNRGCLETLVSGPAFIGEGVRLMKTGGAPRLHEMVEGEASRVSPKEMAQAARDGDLRLQDAIAQRGAWLGVGVANVVTTIHPELVVIGGGVSRMGDLLLDPVRKAVRERVRMIPVDDVRIETSLLDEQAGLFGAVALAAESVVPNG